MWRSITWTPGCSSRPRTTSASASRAVRIRSHGISPGVVAWRTRPALHGASQWIETRTLAAGSARRTEPRGAGGQARLDYGRAPRPVGAACGDAGDRVEREVRLVKVAPLSGWTEAEIWDYIRHHDVPYNRLHDEGYPSLGCDTRCTSRPLPGESLRSGRWSRTVKDRVRSARKHLGDGQVNGLQWFAAYGRQEPAGVTIWLTGLSGRQDHAGGSADAGTAKPRPPRGVAGRRRGAHALEQGPGVHARGPRREHPPNCLGGGAGDAARGDDAGVGDLPYNEGRREAREQIGEFVEVYVKCSLDQLFERDPKGLYAKALRVRSKTSPGSAIRTRNR